MSAAGWPELLCVAGGGALGASSRYLMGKAVQAWAAVPFPVGTLSVNVFGCLLFGFLFTRLHPAGAGSVRLHLFLPAGRDLLRLVEEKGEVLAGGHGSADEDAVVAEPPEDGDGAGSAPEGRPPSLAPAILLLDLLVQKGRDRHPGDAVRGDLLRHRAVGHQHVPYQRHVDSGKAPVADQFVPLAGVEARL